ncbi:MAG: hypothetical protein VX265_04800, partial [Myxococcota bacterium]|nr:hypothetical protein [Myxococcota bacterium]
MILPDSALTAAARRLLEREGLNPDEAIRLVRIFDRGEARQLKNGEVLFEEGDAGDSMAILIQG